MKFSIIVPIYNAENHLDDCVNYLINQDFDDYEVVLIDDGSTDNSYSICLNYQEKFENIKVIKKENGGVGSARNCGIENASGKYILFVDSDDFLRKNTISVYSKSISEYDSDIVISGYIHKKVETGKEFLKNYNQKWTGSIDEFVKDLFGTLFDNWLIHAPWNKIYKKSIIDKYNIRFSEQYSIYEDIGFVLDYLNCCNSVLVIPDILYDYNVKEQGSLVTKFHENAHEAYLDCWVRLKELLKYNDNAEKYKVYICNCVFGYLKSLYKNKDTEAFRDRDIIIKQICEDERFKDLTKGLKMKKIHQKTELFLMKYKLVLLLRIMLRFIYKPDNRTKDGRAFIQKVYGKLSNYYNRFR